MHQSSINEKKALFHGVDKPSVSPDLSSLLYTLCFLSYLSSVCASLIPDVLSSFALVVSIPVCVCV